MCYIDTNQMWRLHKKEKSMIQQPNIAQLPQSYPQGGANAVSINIYNPQAYGTAPQNAPYQYTNSLYQMPQGQIYPQQAQTVEPNPQVYQQYIPMQQPTQPVIAPAPQLMPDSVIPQTQPQAQSTEQAKPVEVVENKTEQVPSVDVDSLIKDLKAEDSDVQAQAINKIATYAQEKPEIALQVVSEPVMQALVDVIKKDTTGLEGPTDKQIEIAEKISKGEKLTPEEDAISEQLSPRDKVNKNRIFALYTLAIIQKLQRDELNQYIATQKANGETPIEPLKMQDLIGNDAIQEIIKNDARPEVKVAAIQALQHVAEPQDKETVSTILADSLKSTDEPVKVAAEEAMAKFN